MESRITESFLFAKYKELMFLLRNHNHPSFEGRYILSMFEFRSVKYTYTWVRIPKLHCRLLHSPVQYRYDKAEKEYKIPLTDV